MKSKSLVNKHFHRLMLCTATMFCGLVHTSHPVSAQGPGVQVIRLNVRDEATPAPAASSVLQPILAIPTNTSGNSADASASTAASNPAGAKTVLTGEASAGHAELANVRDILLDVRRAQTAAVHLYAEVTRHPITGYSYADTMGPVMVEIPLPTFDTREVLPARRQWVELYSGEITTMLAFVKTDNDGIKSTAAELSLPASDRSTFERDLQECSASIERAIHYGAQLKQLAVAPPYDNLAIAKLISPLHKDLKEVEKTTRRLIGQIKKSH